MITAQLAKDNLSFEAAERLAEEIEHLKARLDNAAAQIEELITTDADAGLLSVRATLENLAAQLRASTENAPADNLDHGQ